MISVSKRLRSESKINIEVVEGSTSGSSKISVALNEDGIKYEKTFTINKGVHPFTSETKICWIYTDEAVKDVEEMSRNANAEVQINPAFNAKANKIKPKPNWAKGALDFNPAAKPRKETSPVIANKVAIPTNKNTVATADKTIYLKEPSVPRSSIL